MEAKWKQNGTFGTFRFKGLMGLKRRNKQENQRVTRFSPRGCYCTFRFTPLKNISILYLLNNKVQIITGLEKTIQRELYYKVGVNYIIKLKI
jgi:hypothetical protein